MNIIIYVLLGVLNPLFTGLYRWRQAKKENSQLKTGKYVLITVITALLLPGVIAWGLSELIPSPLFTGTFWVMTCIAAGSVVANSAINRLWNSWTRPAEQAPAPEGQK